MSYIALHHIISCQPCSRRVVHPRTPSTGTTARNITCSGRFPVADFITIRHADALLIDALHCAAHGFNEVHVAGIGTVSS